MKRLAFFSWIVLWAFPVFAGDAPILMDVTVLDAMEGPYLEPLEFTFMQGQEYLLVMRNDNGYGVNFNYDKFGQNIFTRLLQGTPDVSQEGFGLPSNSKVLWLFAPSLAGEYSFYVSHSGMNLQGKIGKIRVLNGMEESVKILPTPLEKEATPSPSSEHKSSIKSFLSHHKK